MPKILYFPFFGPNRRSDLRVIEARLEFSASEANETGFEQFVAHVGNLLKSGGVLTNDESFPPEPAPDGHMAGYTSLLAQTALLFQKKAAHRVRYHEVRTEPRRLRSLALVEHEHCDVGMTAMKLAVEVLTGKRTQLAEPFRRFSEFARERLLPLETEAIIDAANRRGIPYLQLDRPPFRRAPARHEPVRQNGLVQLGQGARGLVLDGTFCRTRATRSILELLEDPKKRRTLLSEASLTSPAGGHQGQSRSLLRLLVIGGEVTPLLDGPDGELIPLSSVHPSLHDLATRLHARLDHQAVEIRLATNGDPATSGSERFTGIDFCLGPDLGRLARSEKDRDGMASLRSAADRLVDSLFPDPATSRIPTIAITGTNGKTTTSRLVAHILRHAGYRTGLVCTDGVYLDDELQEEGDRCTLAGHAALLARRQVEAAVLETHHRGIAVRGFAFHECDVGVALNVTDDHIKAGEIDSIEEMAEIKRAVPERAREAAVLFADDARCRAMLPHMRCATPWLVSLESSVGELRALAGNRSASFCSLETNGEEEIIVIHADGRRREVLPVADMPLAHGGTARFNVANAMHAIAAARAVGVSLADIRTALESFGSTSRHVPGRLNVVEDLPFRLVLDFAHNPDGVSKMAAFADRQNVEGRKVLALAAAPGRDPEFCQAIARAAAGHFDLYFCKDYTRRAGYENEPLAPQLKESLRKSGVPESQIVLTTHGKKAALEILSACRPGDLLIYLVGHVEMHQMDQFIEEFSERQRSGESAP